MSGFAPLINRAVPLVLLGLLLTGCATTPKIDWAGRVGNYTYEQAILDFGPPDKYAKLTDGTIVAEWLTRRGYTTVYSSPHMGFYPWYYGPYYPSYFDSITSPDVFLRLVFGPDGRLKGYKNFSR